MHKKYLVSFFRSKSGFRLRLRSTKRSGNRSGVSIKLRSSVSVRSSVTLRSSVRHSDHSKRIILYNLHFNIVKCQIINVFHNKEDLIIIHSVGGRYYAGTNNIHDDKHNNKAIML